MRCAIWYHLYNKREKHPCRRANFSKVAGYKSRNASHYWKSCIKTLRQRANFECDILRHFYAIIIGLIWFTFSMWRCMKPSSFIRDALTIWYHLHKLKNLKNIPGGKLLLVKLQAEACNFTKNNTPPWVFFTFLKILQMVPNCATHCICLVKDCWS